MLLNLLFYTLAEVSSSETLHGTGKLEMEGDLAAKMVEGIHMFLMRKLDASIQERESLWNRDYSSLEAYAQSISPNRERFARIIGAVDKRENLAELEYISSTKTPALITKTDGYSVYAVRWKVFEGVYGEGLWLEPDNKPSAQIVALPDADWTPEMLMGLTAGIPYKSQFARRLAENGCRVIIPVLIDRSDTWSGNPAIRMTNQPHREFIYRMAFELGRHIIGYEVQKILAVIDWFSGYSGDLPMGVIGYGEGGLLAFYSAALDTRIDATVVSGYFQSRQRAWEEPIYRNVWRLLYEFGDAEIASLIAPRDLIIEAGLGPELDGPPPPHDGRSGAAPGKLVSPALESVETEFDRASGFYEKLRSGEKLTIVKPEDNGFGSDETLIKFLSALGDNTSLKPTKDNPIEGRKDFDPQHRSHRQFKQLVDFTQRLLNESQFRRQEFWSKADKSSLETWEESCEYYRDYLWDEVIGRFPPSDIPANPRTRLAYDQPNWKGYEVALDVWKDVFAYGILLVPKDIKPKERRPVVVCQHGLEGRASKPVESGEESPYNNFGAKLADRGFVVYAPQNPYIGGDSFRVLQRKANLLGKSLFSIIVRQHQRTLEWLSQQPFVDPDRIGFYGISYGGKTAMRVPALLKSYTLSICSADFNEWITKNATVDHRYSYMFTGEYEMPEFDLGNTFNYSDMAGLILPRPFMVERGHHDGVAPDEWVAYEYARVRRLYTVLGIPERTSIEFFNGGHQINAQGTFEFLHRWLSLPDRKESGN
jgi:dienelactone hydrolase